MVVENAKHYSGEFVGFLEQWDFQTVVIILDAKFHGQEHVLVLALGVQTLASEPAMHHIKKIPVESDAPLETGGGELCGATGILGQNTSIEEIESSLSDPQIILTCIVARCHATICSDNVILVSYKNHQGTQAALSD